MTVFIYTRASTSGQSLTHDTQSAACRKYVETQKARGALDANVALVEKREIASGSIEFNKRAIGKEVLTLAKKGDWLVVAKLDRAFRNTRDCLNVIDLLKKRGVKLHLLDLQFGEDACVTNGMNQLIVTIMSAVSTWERERIGERTRDAKQHQKSKGVFVGGKVEWNKMLKDGVVVENPSTTAAVKRMRDLRRGGMSLRRILQDKALKRSFDKLGKKCSLTTVAKLTDDVTTTDMRKRGRRKIQR